MQRIWNGICHLRGNAYLSVPLVNAPRQRVCVNVFMQTVFSGVLSRGSEDAAGSVIRLEPGSSRTRCRWGAMLPQAGWGLHHSCFSTTHMPQCPPLPRLFQELEVVHLVLRLLLYLHPPPPASVVGCFHRKLARRPLRWVACTARYLPVTVLRGCRIHLLPTVSLAPRFFYASPPDRCNCALNKCYFIPNYYCVCIIDVLHMSLLGHQSLVSTFTCSRQVKQIAAVLMLRPKLIIAPP